MGSNYLPKPLSLVCIILAISARLNIRGTNVSFGANPHSIGKRKRRNNHTISPRGSSSCPVEVFSDASLAIF